MKMSPFCDFFSHPEPNIYLIKCITLFLLFQHCYSILSATPMELNVNTFFFFLMLVTQWEHYQNTSQYKDVQFDTTDNTSSQI